MPDFDPKLPYNDLPLLPPPADVIETKAILKRCIAARVALAELKQAAELIPNSAVLVNARLYPDMFPLARQVQVASDIARRGGARLAGQDPMVVEDDEQTLEDLIGRVRGVIDFLETLRPDQIDGAEERAITFQLRGREVTFDGQTFLLNFVLPNVYFHITTAYNILRHNGVVLGKPDFLGGF